MTPLAAELCRRIAATGPITIADYMAECLLHPTHGYYTTRPPFGTKGDFVTAPEISQMFGELLGLFLAQCWMDQGCPARFALAEPGPGRGTLMADILRTIRAVPGFADAAEVHLVEASLALRKEQAATLGDHHITWHDTVHDLPDLPLFLVANEFFDALPIRQFVRQGDGWSERMVGCTEGVLSDGLSSAVPLADLCQRLEDTTDGDLVETCPGARPAIVEITGRIADKGGVALVIDYGDWRSLGDTLQAVRKHRTEGIFAHPGQADLTAHVDFEALAAACADGVSVTRLTPQGMFLERLGITDRARALAERLQGAQLENHIAAHRRLTHHEEMGLLFKAMAFYKTGMSVPPGFTE